MSLGATLFAYIIAGVFFILTLRGLSSPETARKGNMYGMVGMAIAILTTLTSPVVQEYVWIVGGIVALCGATAVISAGFVLDRFGFPAVGLSLTALLALGLIPMLRLKEPQIGVYAD